VELRGFEPLTPSMRTKYAGLRTWCVWLFPQFRGGDAGAITASDRVCQWFATPILLPAG